MFIEPVKHKTVKLTIQTRVPEWARWFAVSEDGSVFVFRYKPQCDSWDTCWSSKKERHNNWLGVKVLGSHANINGDGGQTHCQHIDPQMYYHYFKTNPRVKNWRELVYRIYKSDFC